MDDADGKDLPKTQMAVLGKIVAKAEGEKAYGHLMRAQLNYIKLQNAISPDSLAGDVRLLEAKERTASNEVLRAVYNVAIARIYANCGIRLLDSRAAADTMVAVRNRKAMAHPDILAAADVGEYKPFAIEGYNASVFGGDMLSAVGYATNSFVQMYHYYNKVGNRRAACMSALYALKSKYENRADYRTVDLNKSAYICSLDSLIAIYKDLDVAGEAAVERYNYMSCCGKVTPEQRNSYINYVLANWGGWQRAGELRNEQKSLTSPWYSVVVDSTVVAAGVTTKVMFDALRNVSKMDMTVYKLNIDGDTKLDPQNDKEYARLKQRAVRMPEYGVHLDFMSYPDWHVFKDSVQLHKLPVGVYMVEIQSTPATGVSRFLYRVSNIKVIRQYLPDKYVRFVAVDRTSGQPVKGARLRVTTNGTYGRKATVRTLVCDDKGETLCKYGAEQPDRVFAYTGSDRANADESAFGRFYYYSADNAGNICKLFTDRRIYRPGQKVNVAAIVYKKDGVMGEKAAAGQTMRLALKDANYTTVTEKTVTTDRFGKASAEFYLPQNVLTGSFRIEADQPRSTVAISVEQYKRPTFAVEFPKINTKYEAGDTVVVRAKAMAYSGVPVQRAKVKYKVERRRALWWGDYTTYAKKIAVADSDYKLLAVGETTTADDGEFVIEMPMELPEDSESIYRSYNIIADVDVTDLAGESHSGSISLPLSRKQTFFACDVPQKVLSDSLNTITFTLKNNAGVDVKASVRYYIDKPDKWHEASTTVPVAVGAKFKSGKHSLFAVCENDTLKHDFVVFSLDDKRPATDTREWFYVQNTRFEAGGKPVTVQVGSSDSDVHIVYSIISGDKVLESGATSVSNSLINRKFTYKESYGNGLLLTYAWVKDGKMYAHRTTISRPLPDKKLKMKWTTFRDRLTPGQKEEWTLSILNPDGTPANAQLMATMYDKSLDQLSRHSWNFSTSTYMPLPSALWSGSDSRPHYGGASGSWKPLAFKPFGWTMFDYSVFPEYYGVFYCGAESTPANGMRLMGTKKMAMSRAPLAAKQMASKVEDKMLDAAETAVAEAEDAGSKPESHAATGQLRENLNETALFYPALTTDAAGNVAIRFTLPESLTSWHFMGMAHTADMNYGMIDTTAVAKKDVMVQPNIPRFLRTGDKATIVARVVNTSDVNVEGQAVMQLIDPETDKVVYGQTLDFAATAGQTATVEFGYRPDGSRSLLVCRITASGSSFSDGEQHYLPILPDKERVTVTVPFTQNEPGKKTVDVAGMFKGNRGKGRLTVEYTDNPAWLMMQALPSVGTAGDDNAVSLAAAIYANAMSRHIIDGAPEVAKVFALWKNEPEGKGSLVSQLQKNSELKDIVLSETPWVADASAESEQKRRMADFFDRTSIDYRLDMFAEKLAKLQNPDGSWSWWKGMPGSSAMTTTVAEMLVRLDVVANATVDTKNMLALAFKFADRETVEMVNRMKANERKGIKQGFPSQSVLRYLYITAISGRKLTVDASAARDYLIPLLKKDMKGQSIYEKAMTAVVLSKHGEQALARQYVKSIKEYSVYTEEKGRYFDTPRAVYSWFDYKIPTQVMALEAIAAVTPADKAAADEMKRWLLQSKRTQAWDTPINSVNAIHAFMAGSDKLQGYGEPARLAIDGKAVSLPKATAAIGYVKTAVDTPCGSKFTVHKTSDGTSWGALYAQFEQPVAEVSKSSSGMSVERKVLDADGKEADLRSLKTGDKIKVRITIKAERDFDFVQIKDSRAACMEPVGQLSRYRQGAYCAPKDNATYYYIERMPKGKRVVETEYYIDRPGVYQTGICTAGCAYAPEYHATAPSVMIEVAGK